MSEAHNHHSDADFESQDLGAKPIYWSLVGLAAVLLLAYGAMQGVYYALNEYSLHQAEKAEHNPLVKVTVDPGQRRETAYAPTQDAIKHTFPEPRLEEDERAELNDIRVPEEDRLNSYGWADEKAGTVHIPIERAMQLIVQRGLPTRPQTGTTPPSVVNTVNQAAAKPDQSAVSSAAKKKGMK